MFDAASSLLNVCQRTSYEGQAAMQLEGQVTTPINRTHGWQMTENQLSLLPLFHELLSCDAITGANLFHGTLGNALVAWVVQAAEQYQRSQVILAGGCFMNSVLSEWVITALRACGLNPLYPRLCPPNDGGLSLGQAWIAGNRLELANK